jgi:putative addiction module component (TIGR02574 family)
VRVTKLETLLTEALTLPAVERARLALALLRSLDHAAGDSAEQISTAWTTELAQRLQDIREGKVALIDLDDVDAYVAEQLAAVRR